MTELEHQEGRHSTAMIAAVAASLILGSVLLVVSSISDGIWTRTLLITASGFLTGLAAGSVPLFRAIFLDAFKRPTKRTVLERFVERDHVTVRIFNDDAPGAAAHHARP